MTKLDDKIQKLTEGWLDETGHLVKDRISYVCFERGVVVLDGDFDRYDLGRVVQVLEAIAAADPEATDPGLVPDNPPD